MYQQIADDLRVQIESGELAPGTMLPTEIELREQYEASRNTIRDAIRRLASIGLVETLPGQGTFVVQRIDPFVTELTTDPSGGIDKDGAAYLSAVAEVHRQPLRSIPRVEVQVPHLDISIRLRKPSDAQVVSRHQERYIDNVPWSVQTSFYPMDFVTTGKAPLLLKAEDIEEGVLSYLAQTMGIQQAGYRDWITARLPDADEQEFFKITPDTTLFEIFRTSFDQTGAPIRVTVTVYPADRNQFIVNVGQVSEPR
jgi:GntR family transcriptional regulator